MAFRNKEPTFLGHPVRASACYPDDNRVVLEWDIRLPKHLADYVKDCDLDLVQYLFGMLEDIETGRIPVEFLSNGAAHLFAGRFGRPEFSFEKAVKVRVLKYETISNEKEPSDGKPQS